MHKSTQSAGKSHLIFLLITAVTLVTAVFLMLWYHGCFLPGWISWKNSSCEIIPSDSELSVTICLQNRHLTISRDDQMIFETPDNYKIQDFQWGDINNDSKPELLLLCWKIGTYGEHRPFWVEKNDHRWSQHIFIYQWDAGNITPLWMASDIGMEVQDWHYDDHGYLILLDRNEQLSSWAWLSWGLEQVDTEVTFLAAGDVIIHEPIFQYGLSQGNFDFLYENVADTIHSADIAVMNQETIYTSIPSHYSDFPRFGTPLLAGEAVEAAGFDVVTAANNHALDQGMEGIDTTYEFYQDRDILCLGIEPSPTDHNTIEESPTRDDTPYQIIRRKRIRFALLNYTYGLNGLPLPEEQPDAVHTLYDEDRVRADIRAAKEAADLVIVFVHWGTEYETQPDEQETYWADVFLQEGVDAVIGTHPHVLQPYEWMTGEDGHRMLVYYSLGNFISAQDTLERVVGGMAEFKVEITIDGCEITQAQLLPVITHQSEGRYTAYLLKDYTEELAAKHRLGVTLEDLLQYADRILPVQQ